MKVRFKIIQKGTIGAPPLIMIHGDQSNRLLPSYLDDEIPFYIFTHMGNEERKYPLISIPEIAAIYIEKLKLVYPKGPMILTGFSIGGVIAYEMAQQLNKIDNRKVNLVLLDSKAPRLQSNFEFHNLELKLNESIVSKTYRRIYKKAWFAFYSITKIKMSEKHFFYNRMQQYRKARRLYAVKPYYGDLILIKSEKNNFKDPYLGWEDHIKGRISFYSITGDHHHIVMEPCIQEVAKIYKEIFWNTYNKKGLLDYHPTALNIKIAK